MRGNKTDKLSRILNRTTWGKRAIEDIRRRFKQIDAIVLIDDNPWLFREVEKIGEKYGSKLIHDCVEWYSPEEYKWGKLDIHYRLKDHVNKKAINEKWDVISISQYLYNWFLERCHRTVKIPVILDMFDIEEPEFFVPNTNDKVSFTYDGAPGKQDYLDTILTGFSLLDKELLEKVEIHIIGVNRDQLINACGVDERIIDELGTALYIHGRVPHEEAVSWVRSADFTLLLRDEHLRYAIAGFPTKIVESLKYGTPPICNITSDLGQYLIDQKNAIIIDGCNSESVEKAIQTALQMDSVDRDRMRKAARETAIVNFDFRLYSNQIMGLLTD
jgi:glycosyltransferase involved in cell wall biosynthesis